jgi:hypothetical protein
MPGGKLALMDAGVPRGFRGELHHVRYGSELLRIRSGEAGADLRKEVSARHPLSSPCSLPQRYSRADQCPTAHRYADSSRSGLRRWQCAESENGRRGSLNCKKF